MSGEHRVYHEVVEKLSKPQLARSGADVGHGPRQRLRERLSAAVALA
jgi:hypothetical protein